MAKDGERSSEATTQSISYTQRMFESSPFSSSGSSSDSNSAPYTSASTTIPNDSDSMKGRLAFLSVVAEGPIYFPTSALMIGTRCRQWLLLTPYVCNGLTPRWSSRKQVFIDEYLNAI
jgi:hypothetical protein